MKLRRRWSTGWRQDLLRMIVFVATVPLVFPLTTLRAAEPHYTIEMAQKANSDAYTTFTNEYRNLHASMATVRVAIEANETERLAFVAVEKQHAVLLNSLYEEAPKLTEAFRLLCEDAKGVEIVSVQVVQLSESNYGLSVQVNCASSQLPGLLKKLNMSILVGQLLSLGIGIGIGSAMGGATSVASAGGSVNGWTGGVTTATSTSHSLFLPLVFPLFMGGGGGGQQCSTGACVAQPRAACIECGEGRPKTCVDCNEKGQKKSDTFCPDCKLPLKYGVSPSSMNSSPTPLAPIPEGN